MTSAKLFFVILVATFAGAQTAASSKEVESAYPAAHALYLDLHQNPELSSHETQTAAKLANQLRGLGYDVTEHVGGTGVVAILKNGSGPTVTLRTELDALPVEEKTGLPYASTVHAKDDAGNARLRARPAHGIARRHGGDYGAGQEKLARHTDADRAAR